MATIWITGANRGIGLALVQHYLSAGDTVMAICRTSSEQLRNTSATIIEGLDVTDPQSYSVLNDALVQHPVDVWIHNAGVLQNEGLAQIDAKATAQILNQFRINALGPLLLTNYIYSYFSDASKCIVITSRMGSIADNSSGGRYGYRMSKAALNAMAQSLAVDLKPFGVSVGIIHPGWVKTDMTGHTGHVSAEQSAHNIIQRIAETNLENSGTFWHADGSVLPW